MKQMFTLCCLVLLGLAVCQTPQARTLRVSNSNTSATGEQFATIQSAIDAAVNGDTVEVATGTYSGAGNRDIDFNGKMIIVYSGGQPENTIIDCGGSSGAHHGAFRFHSGETIESIVEGFTIINAYFATDGGVDTGAIHCVDASPFIIGCIIRNNTSHGLTTAGSATPSVFNCAISDNTGHGVAMGVGAGSTGGGSFNQVTIYHNDRAGIALPWNVDSIRSFMNCTVVSNDSGGMRFVGTNSDPNIVDTVYTYLYANIIAFNKIAGLQKTGQYFPGIVVYCSDVFGNPTNYLNVVDATADTANNFSADPKFCDTATAKYTLLAGSPCLPGPGGNPCFTMVGSMGAGTCTPSSCCVGTRGNVDCDAGQGVDISDLSRLIDNLFISFDPLCCVDEANIDGEGTVDISDLSMLIDNLFISLNPLPSCQ
jgi:hypothetical protein